MSSDAAVVERAIAEMLGASLPERLQKTTGPEKVKEWVERHLDRYAEKKAKSPDESPLPWSSWICYDSWLEPSFFVVMTLTADAIELFCGTGEYWPEVRHFGEREIEGVAASEWYRAWSSRFDVPCPPLVLGKAVVKAWLGRDW
jgi:hypothetical protein